MQKPYSPRPQRFHELDREPGSEQRALAITSRPRPAAHGKRHRQEIAAELQRFCESHAPALDGVSWQTKELLRRIHDRLFDPALKVGVLKESCLLRDHNVSCRFKYEVGISIKSYIESLRLKAANALLRASPVTVSEAAQAVGYRHLQTYYRAVARNNKAHANRSHPRSGADEPDAAARGGARRR